MTPIEFAERLSDSGDHRDRVLGVAIIARGLSDDDDLRQGWPLDGPTVRAAARHLKLDPTPDLVADALALAPKLGNGILNKRG